MKSPSDYFADGMAARHKGQPIESCGLLYKAWPYDCWRLGWQFANVVRQVPSAYKHEGSLEEVIKTPYEQGVCQYYEGRAIHDGPYEPNSPHGLQWEAGWVAAEGGFVDGVGELKSCSLSWRNKPWFWIFAAVIGFWLAVGFAILSAPFE